MYRNNDINEYLPENAERKLVKLYIYIYSYIIYSCFTSKGCHNSLFIQEESSGDSSTSDETGCCGNLLR